MKCGFCQRDIPPPYQVDPERKSCGSCFGGCRKLHCPWCGYPNPLPGKFLRRLLEKQAGKQ